MTMPPIHVQTDNADLIDFRVSPTDPDVAVLGIYDDDANRAANARLGRADAAQLAAGLLVWLGLDSIDLDPDHQPERTHQ